MRSAAEKGSASSRSRKSVAVTAEDLHDLEIIRRSPEAAGLDGRATTESAVLAHALHEGIRLLREAHEGALYAAEAAERAGSPEDAQRRERRNRSAQRQERAYQ